MVEQYVEKYEISCVDDMTQAQNDMNDNISRGWCIKNMVLTPNLTRAFPFMFVVYEREVINCDSKENNIS